MSLCDGLQLPKLVEVRVSPLEVVVCTFGFNLKNYGHSCPQDVFWVSTKNKHNFIVCLKKGGHTSFETYLRYTPYRFQRVQWIFFRWYNICQHEPMLCHSMNLRGRQHLKVGDPPKQILSKLSFPAFFFSIHSLFELHMHF